MTVCENITIRPLGPEDRSRLVASLAHYSDHTLYRRFHAPKRTFTSSELRYLTELDGRDRYAVVAEDESGVLVAVGRYVRLGDSSRAEVALVVADAYQGRGLATELLQHLRHHALNCDLLHFQATVQSDNRAARRLLERAGGSLKARDGAELTYCLPLNGDDDLRKQQSLTIGSCSSASLPQRMQRRSLR